jgi:branched-chain amino acid transport system substrate-binding protein
VATGASRWGDPQHFPWTMGWQANYRSEARIYAAYMKKTYPGKTIGILYQNDDFGKDYLAGLKDVLGDDYAKLVISEVPFEVSVPTVDSQVVSIKSANPDIFVNIGTPKFAAQAIKKAAEIGWKPLHLLNSVSNSIGGVLQPAGLDNAAGLLTTFYVKDPTDPTWKDDPAIKEWSAFMDKYFPEGDKSSTFSVYGYATAQTLVQVLKQCGDDLTRENVMKQATNLKDFEVGLLLPGIKINTSPTDYYPIEQMQMSRFNGEHGELFGTPISGEIGAQ